MNYNELKFRETLPVTWKFSDLVPTLPVLGDKAYLDCFVWVKAELVYTSAASGRYTFEGEYSSSSVLGLFALLLNKPSYPIYGSINAGLPSTPVEPIPFGKYPFEVENVHTLPGITLHSDLDASFSLFDKLYFNNLALDIYSPPSVDFVAQNNTWYSYFRYSCELSIPALEDFKADIYLDYDPLGLGITAVADIENLSLSSLVTLADTFFGGSALEDFLPDAVKSALKKLCLTQIAFTLNCSGGEIDFSYASATVGVPELNWNVYGGVFEVKSVFLRFERNGDRNGVTLTGVTGIMGKQVTVSASYSDGFKLYARLDDGVTIPLDDWLGQYCSLFQFPAKLDIDAASFEIAFGQYYTFYVRALEEQKWLLDLGITRLGISNVAVLITYRNSSFDGYVSGSLSVGQSAAFDIFWQLPNALTVKGKIPRIGIADLFRSFCSADVIPSYLAFTFIDTEIIIEYAGNAGDLHLIAATNLENFGRLALEVKKLNGEWGFAFGLEVGSASGKLPGAGGAVRAVADLLGIDTLTLVLSSLNDTSFIFPAFNRFDGVDPHGQITLTNGIVKGFNLYGKWLINTSDSKQKLLKNFLNLSGELDLTVQVSSQTEVTGFISYSGTICGCDAVLKAGARFGGASAEFFLAGRITVPIKGTTQIFDAELAFTVNGAFLAASMTGSEPVDCGWFKLGNLALQIGISFEGIPSFGVAASVTAGKLDGSVAVFLDSAAPQKSLVAGSISDISVGDVVEAVTGETANEILDNFGIVGINAFNVTNRVSELQNALDNLDTVTVSAILKDNGLTIPSQLSDLYWAVSERGARWFITDMSAARTRHYQFVKSGGAITVSTEAQFYIAPSVVTIGARTYSQGFYIAAGINFFGYHASAEVDLSYNSGIKVSAQMDKLVLFDERLFSLTSADGTGGASLYISAPKDFSCKIDGKITLLGCGISCRADADKNGLVFKIGLSLGIVELSLAGRLDKTGVDFSGSVFAGVPDIDLGSLGTLKIKTGVTGAVKIYANAGAGGAALSLSTAFFSQTINIGTLSLDVTKDELEDLGDLIAGKTKAFFTELFEDAKKWAIYVVNGIIEGITDLAESLVELFGLSRETAVRIMEAAYEYVWGACGISDAAFVL